MIEIALSAVAIVLSVMCTVFVIVRKPMKGEKGDPGMTGPIGPMGMRGQDGKCWVYKPADGRYLVGYYLYNSALPDENIPFIVVNEYVREQDAARRVHYLNGGA